ncbi:MAG: pilin [Patescibacteria group bacterium]|nr:pilin [Patescibacteria group bacterium]
MINLKKIRSKVLSVFAVLFVLSANIANAKWESPSQPTGVPSDFDSAILNATNWILGFVGMIAVLMLIWGGVTYLTSAGDEDKAKTGKKTLSYAIIGLVIAGIAYAIVDVIVTTILA